jgi:8-oxo-dGTP pyrophosphatase MutT (NUDIX family)
VRVVLRDARGALLLVLTRDPDLPELPAWWELPGGGLDTGEDAVTAAVREIAEETGLAVDPATLRRLPWTRSVRYVRHGRTVVQDEVVLAAELPDTEPPTSRSGLTEQEQVEVVELAWWPRDRLLLAEGPFWPARLPELVPWALSGGAVVESVEDRMPPGT